LPPYIDISELPQGSQWFCDMNYWDPSRASCDAPEETADENEITVAEDVTTAVVSASAVISAPPARADGPKGSGSEGSDSDDDMKPTASATAASSKAGSASTAKPKPLVGIKRGLSQSSELSGGSTPKTGGGKGGATQQGGSYPVILH
jgi:hypothetical protein